MIFFTLSGALSSIFSSYASTLSDPVITAKYNYFLKHKDKYNTIFFGSSRMYRGFSPSIFDDEMRKRGFKSRSFNFGAPSLVPPESYLYIKKILDSNPKNLKIIVIELHTLKTIIESNQIHVPRYIYWHNLKNTAFVISALIESNVTFKEKAVNIKTHLMQFAKNMVNLGKGLMFLKAIARGKMQSEGNLAKLGPELDGFYPRDADDDAQVVKVGKMFQHGREAYEKIISELTTSIKNNTYDKKMLSTAGEMALSDILEKIRDNNIEPIIVLLPTVRKYMYGLMNYGKDKSGVRILKFHNPVNSPEIYKYENHWDNDHLNLNGAEIYSAILAKDFSYLLENSKP